MKLKAHDMNLVNIREVTPNVFLCEFPTQYLLTSTFIRFQEYYESPEFKGKFFTMEEYEDYYAEEFGNFDYYQKVGGCNFTSSCVDAWMEQDIQLLLREKEIEFIFKFKKDTGKTFKEKFYIIGIVYNDETLSKNIKHEVAHGLFNTNQTYRENVKEILENHKEADLSIIEEYLELKNYHKDAFEDETQAYLMEKIEYLIDRFHNNARLSSIKDWRKM